MYVCMYKLDLLLKIVQVEEIDGQKRGSGNQESKKHKREVPSLGEVGSVSAAQCLGARLGRQRCE